MGNEIGWFNWLGFSYNPSGRWCWHWIGCLRWRFTVSNDLCSFGSEKCSDGKSVDDRLDDLDENEAVRPRHVRIRFQIRKDGVDKQNAGRQRRRFIWSVGLEPTMSRHPCTVIGIDLMRISCKQQQISHSIRIGYVTDIFVTRGSTMTRAATVGTNMRRLLVRPCARTLFNITLVIRKSRLHSLCHHKGSKHPFTLTRDWAIGWNLWRFPSETASARSGRAHGKSATTAGAMQTLDDYNPDFALRHCRLSQWSLIRSQWSPIRRARTNFLSLRHYQRPTLAANFFL